MDILIKYWDVILFLVCALVGFGYFIYKYLSLPTSKKKQKIRSVLLDLVMEAEIRFESKSGKVKFAYVYELLCKKFMWLKFIPLTVIEELVDEALNQMREMLDSPTEEGGSK